MARETVEIQFPAWKQTPMIAELFHKKRHCELTLISALCSEVNVLGNAGNALEQLFENGDTIQAEEIQCHSMIVNNYSELVCDLIQAGKFRKRKIVNEATGAVSEGSGCIVEIPDIRFDILSLWIEAMYTGVAEVKHDLLQLFVSAAKALKVDYTALLSVADSISGSKAANCPTLSPFVHLDLMRILSDASRAEKSKVANADANKRHDQLNLAAKWVAIEFLRHISASGDVETEMKQYLPSFSDRHWWHILYVLQGKSDLLRGTKYLVSDATERRVFTVKEQTSVGAEEAPPSFSVWRFQIVKMFTLWEKEYQEHLDETPLRKFCYDMVQKIQLTEAERVNVVVLHFEHKDLSGHSQWLKSIQLVVEAKSVTFASEKSREYSTPGKSPLRSINSPAAAVTTPEPNSAEVREENLNLITSKKARPSRAREQSEEIEVSIKSDSSQKKRTASSRADVKRGRK